MERIILPAQEEFDIGNPSGQSEGHVREYLARYFLFAPPREKQNDEQRKAYRQALRLFLGIETRAVLRTAGLSRPLSWGDLTALLEAVAHAAAALSAECDGNPIVTHTNAQEGQGAFCAFDPRLIQMAATGLIRGSCLANPSDQIAVSIRHCAHSVIFAVCGKNGIREERSLAVAKETARLHGGSLAVCDGTAAFSMRTDLLATGGFYDVPTPEELLRQPLSCIQVGLYSSLS